MVESQTSHNIAHNMQLTTHNTQSTTCPSTRLKRRGPLCLHECPAMSRNRPGRPTMVPLRVGWTSDQQWYPDRAALTSDHFGPRTFGPSDAVNPQPDDPYQIRWNLACICQEISGKWPKYSLPTSTTGGCATGGSSSHPGAGTAGAGAALLLASSLNARAARW